MTGKPIFVDHWRFTEASCRALFEDAFAVGAPSTYAKATSEVAYAAGVVIGMACRVARRSPMKGLGWLLEMAARRLTGVHFVYARGGLGIPHSVALTFDDGPSEWTPPILDTFAERGGHATFFVLGGSVAGKEAILRRALAEGHELASHGFTHADPRRLDDATLRDELERTSALLEDVVGVRPRLFRPPYAAKDLRVARIARDAGLSPTVLRSVDPADWRSTDPEHIAAHVLEGVQPGSIVCLHDGLPPHETLGAPDRRATVAALPAILDGLARAGLVPVTVSDLLG